MGIFLSILSFVLVLLVIILLYGVAKAYIFNKVRINKFIPLAISIVLLICQFAFGKLISNYWLSQGFTIITVLFFLWFFDIQQTGGPKKKEKPIKIKPKAKPNRVKNASANNPVAATKTENKTKNNSNNNKKKKKKK